MVKSKEEKPKKEKIKAETKVKAGFVSSEAKVQEIKAEVIAKKPAEADEDIEDEFLEDESDFTESAPSSFNYPFLRRAAPTIRIQPIAANLEIELDDTPVAKKEEDTVDQYKPVPEKNYSINQKYELPGGASYDSMTPKEIKAPASPTLTPNFSDQMNAGRGFGTQQTGTAGYPGQESNERKYDSGLEQQTQSQQDRRRREM